MSAETEITDWARTLLHGLSHKQLVPPGVERLPINRRTAFYAYRDMGPGRSLSALARALGNPPWDGKACLGQLRAWSRAEDWPRACAAWDAEKAETATFDELEMLENLSKQTDAILYSVLDSDDVLQIDIEALTALFDARCSLGERKIVLRRRRAAEAQSTSTDRHDRRETARPPVVPSYVCGPSDRPLALDRNVDARSNDSSAEGTETHNDTMHDPTSNEDEPADAAWDEEEAESEVEDDFDCEDELGLADLVGQELEELPEKYKHNIRPEDGRIRCILVSERNGYVVLMVNTDKPDWFTIETGVRCR